jgi:shikimate kinase
VQAARQIHNIALIGFMGTGKTSIGQILGHLLHFKMLDTDELIERRAGKRISDIFATEGELAFRQYEKEIVRELADLKHHVISTGGGVPVDPENLACLKQHALVVCLWASARVIWERVRRQTHRPLLHDPDPLAKIQELLEQRKPFYRQADVLISTELRSIKEVAELVAHHYRIIQRKSTHERGRPEKGA